VEIRQLRYFISASETKSFTKAAKNCYTSRQNLTRAVRSLEGELGVRLLAYSGNELVLTVQGEQAIEHAKSIVREADLLSDMFKDNSSENVELSVAVGTNADLYKILVPKEDLEHFGEEDSEAMHEVRAPIEEYRNSSLLISQYSCRDCYEMVVEEEVDLAIIACMERDFPGCTSVVLDSEPSYYLVSASSELAEKESLTPSDLSGHSITLFSDYQFVVKPFLDYCELAGMGERKIHASDSVSLMKVAVRKHNAVAIVGSIFGNDPPKGCVAIPTGESSLRWCVYGLYQSNTPNTAKVKRLLDSLMQH
jgi:DNA-binding transcriptional LysR family regulator